MNVSAPERHADIHIEQLPNGYWACRVQATLPLLGEVLDDRGDLFHDAGECFAWAEQQIRHAIESAGRSWWPTRSAIARTRADQPDPTTPEEGR